MCLTVYSSQEESLPYYVIDDVGPKARDTDEQTERPKHSFLAE